MPVLRGRQFEPAATKIFHLVFTHGKLRARTYVIAVFSMFVFLCENGMFAPQQHGERSQKCLGYRLATAEFYLTGGRNVSVLCTNRHVGVVVTL
jgi:hypothetical protein